MTKTTYDGLGRVSFRFSTDSGGDAAPGDTDNWIDADDVTGDNVYDQTEYVYDKFGNVAATIFKQRFHDETSTGALGDATSGVLARVSYTANFYDAANRLTDMVNYGTNGGVTMDFVGDFPEEVPARSKTVVVNSRVYDDAGRLWKTTDPRDLETRNTYDALGRTIKTVQNYTDGTIDKPDENRTVEFAYDGMNHLTLYKAWVAKSQYELTEYDYGVTTGSGSAVNSKDLLAQVLYPSADTVGVTLPQFSYAYNALGQQIVMGDSNGSVHEYTYDVLGRRTADAVVSYDTATVDGSVLLLTTEYDSAGRAYRFTNWDAAISGKEVNQVLREFNGFGQIAVEYQEVDGAVDSTTLNVQYGYSTTDNHSRLVSITHPNGRVLDYDYTSDGDTISRLTSISDGSITLEGYTYLGLGTVVERLHPQAYTNLTYVFSEPGEGGDQYFGLDRFGRVVKQLWWNDDKDEAAVDIRYGYDENGNRIYAQNLLTSDHDELYLYDGLNQLENFRRGTVTLEPLSISDTTRQQIWTMDGLGNFTSLSSTDSVGTTTEDRSHDLRNQLNQIVTDSSSTATLNYDDAGSMITDETGRDFLYDAWNRLVQVNESAHNGYDALGRRVTEGDNTLYYSDKWQVIEERVDDTVTFSYAWSPVYVDAMIGAMVTMAACSTIGSMRSPMPTTTWSRSSIPHPATWSSAMSTIRMGSSRRSKMTGLRTPATTAAGSTCTKAAGGTARWACSASGTETTARR